MNFFRIIAMGAMVFGFSHAIAADTCADKAGAQSDLNQCSRTSLDQIDKELNDLYKAILVEYSNDPKFIEKFKASQRAWLKFRDAELEALFPHKDEDGYYGSAFPMCRSSWLATLTRERIAQIRKWANKVEEGDVCSGSIKFKG